MRAYPEYAEHEVIKFFESTINPRLKEFKTELIERGWDKPETQLLHEFKRDNTMIGEIHATKKGGLCFSYTIWAESSSKSTSKSYFVKFQFGYYKGHTEHPKRNVEDPYNPDITIITPENCLNI